jgi:hypothetical protein
MISHLAYTSFQVPQAVAGKGDPVLTDLAWWWDASRASSYPGTGTTITDIAPAENGWDGTIVNAPTHTAGNAGYFTLNGTSQYIKHTPATSTFLPNNVSLTFEFVMRFTDFSTERPIFSQWGAASGDQAIIITRELTGPQRILVGTRQNGEFDTFGSGVGTDGNWKHFFVTMEYDAPSAGDFNTTVYVNNSSIGTSSWPDYSAWEPTTVDLAWGGRSDLVNYFQGDIAVFRMYEKVLDTTERATNYNLEDAYYSFG